MGLNLEAKKAVVSEVAAALSSASAAMVAEYRGLSVEQVTKLRRKAAEGGITVRVVKNTLARKAVSGTSFECLTDHFTGPVALSSSKDPVAVAKLLADFAKENDALKIRVGAMGGKLITLEQIKALANLPGREQLLAMLLGTMQAPVVKFVRTLNEVPSRFVRTLAAVRDAKQAAG